LSDNLQGRLIICHESSKKTCQTDHTIWQVETSLEINDKNLIPNLDHKLHIQLSHRVQDYILRYLPLTNQSLYNYVHIPLQAWF